MTPERWREVERIFHCALEKAPEERKAFIVKACAGDPELLEEVQSLLACNEEAEDIEFLRFSTQKTALIVDQITERIEPAKKPIRKQYNLLKIASISLLTLLVLCAIWYRSRQSGRVEIEKIEITQQPTLKTTIAIRGKVKFERLSIDQGLSQNTIYCALQDRHGFMWFGTQDGLNRYDGYNFTVFRNRSQDVTSLSNNFVSSLFEDRAGRLWVGTANGGLNRYDPDSQSFIRYQHNANDSNSISSDFINSICQGGENTLWIGTSEGLNRFDIDSGKFTIYRHDENNPASLASDHITKIFKDNSDVLWIGSDTGGLSRFDVGSKNFISYRHDEKNPASLSGNYISAIYQDRDGILWIGTYNDGLNRYDAQNNSFIHYRYEQNGSTEFDTDSISSIYQDQTGILWIGTAEGLYRFDSRNRALSRYLHDAKDPNSISEDRVRTISEDRSGALWFGTVDGGISRYDPNKKLFESIRVVSNFVNSSRNNTTAIYQDHDGRLWVGTVTEGLFRYDAGGDAVRVYHHNPENPDNTRSDPVNAIHEDSSGRLWIGTSSGLSIYDLQKDGFISTKSSSELLTQLKTSPIRCFFEDRSGVMWISIFGRGLGRYDGRDGTLTIYGSAFDRSLGLNSDSITTIYEDRYGMLWFGTLSSGLNRHDPKNGTFVYKYDPGSRSSISNNRISSIYEDHSGTLWIGTVDGLNRYNRDSDSFTSFTKAEGLANNNIYGILEDENGCLWLSTNEGLARFDPKTQSFKNYDVTDGLQSKEFNWGSYFKSSSGEMFFGGINGFNRFYPKNIKENSYIPPIHITSFKTFDTKGNLVFHRNLFQGQSEPVVFAYNHNFFDFEFVALNYTHPEKNRYAYRLEGVDNKWVDCGSQRIARYTKLAPGEYVFRVMGSNNDGFWNREGASIKFIITPPFWNRWWAYILYILCAATAIYSFHLYRLHILQERNRLLEQKVVERTDSVSRKKEELEKKNKELIAKNNDLIESQRMADRIFSALAETLPGTILDGKYRLDKKIGSGGFGAVFRATHIAMKRDVAVKVFKPVPGNDSAEALERFKLEAVSACRVNHPNAVAVLDSGISSEGIAYLVMELLNGCTLTSELRKEGSLSIERCAEILLPICDALSKAHSLGIIHRDIKPDNIFLHQTTEGEVVKVVDFGIAKLIEPETDGKTNKLTVTGGLIGTPFYMAPERVEMKLYDGRSDVYSLGVLLYEMLSGRVPFLPEAGGYAALLLAHMTKVPPSLIEINSRIPKELERVVMRALEKDPSMRPTAKELAEEFTGALEHSKVR
jgi:ligand-binding sensor domain-containing protein